MKTLWPFDSFDQMHLNVLYYPSTTPCFFNYYSTKMMLQFELIIYDLNHIKKQKVAYGHS